MFRVIFIYDEASQKWEAIVEGAATLLEAKQGFNAVVLTCQELDPRLLKHTQIDDNFRITPAAVKDRDESLKRFINSVKE